MERMRALLLNAREDMTAASVEKPEPAGGEVLMRVLAAGICGSDVSRYGKIGPYKPPLIMGHEVFGRVEGKGAGVEDVTVGETGVLVPLVPCGKCPSCRTGRYSLCDDYDLFGARRDGGFAGYIRCPRDNFFRVEGDLPAEEAVFVEPVATAAHALMNVGVRAGDTVAFFGGGVMGMLGAQVAATMGASSVFLVDISGDKIRLAKKVTGAETIDASLVDPVKQILDMTGGMGVDVAVEASGATAAQEQVLLVPKKGGRVVYLGISYLPPVMQARSFQNIARRELVVTGSWMSHSHPFPGREWAFALQVIKERRVRVAEMVTHRISLDDGPAMFRALNAGSIVAGKVLLFPD
ncbi:MAG: galactitol-1-phosphate 5-dehydrogenase [Firmicutes bacterium]|jgi:L-iditol 2-dehydrogenase|nr:galactitol-1-phosphate 5-dehydrogenase [Bacillota bacterium]